VQGGPGVDHVGNITDLSRFETSSCEAVYASHVLEHVDQNDALPTLQGIHRILKTGGKFYVSVPDMDILAAALIKPELSLEDKFLVMRMMFGGQMDPHDYHYFGWNLVFLFNYLRRAGFTHGERVSLFDLFDDTSNASPLGFPISLNVIGTK
jgi:predicted SAM-dependent methyltransferase